MNEIYATDWGRRSDCVAYPWFLPGSCQLDLRTCVPREGRKTIREKSINAPRNHCALRCHYRYFTCYVSTQTIFQRWDKPIIQLYSSGPVGMGRGGSRWGTGPCEVALFNCQCSLFWQFNKHAYICRNITFLCW